MAHGLSCSAACGISPDQDSNPCPLPWEADSQPPRHQGSPRRFWALPLCQAVCRAQGPPLQSTHTLGRLQPGRVGGGGGRKNHTSKYKMTRGAGCQESLGRGPCPGPGGLGRLPGAAMQELSPEGRACEESKERGGTSPGDTCQPRWGSSGPRRPRGGHREPGGG